MTQHLNFSLYIPVNSFADEGYKGTEDYYHRDRSAAELKKLDDREAYGADGAKARLEVWVNERKEAGEMAE
jgi:hypothetical protein